MKAGTKNRARIIGWGLAAIILMALVSWFVCNYGWNPAEALRRAYFEKIVHAVPIGSPAVDFEKATGIGEHFHDGDPRRRWGTVWCPMMVPGFKIQLTAEPVLNANGHISCYQISSDAIFTDNGYLYYEADYK